MQIPGGPAIAPYQPAPGGPTIAPYQPAPAGPAGVKGSIPPFVPGGQLPGAQRWGPSGYNAPTSSGYNAPTSSASASSGGSGSSSGAKALVDRIAKGEVLVGADVAKRLVSQCQATKVTYKQLGELVSERVRRLYLGLDDGGADTDAALARLLSLADALLQQDSELAKNAVKEIKGSVHEELLSLRSLAKYKDQAEPQLGRLGLIGGEGGGAGGAAAADLLGGGGGSSAASAPAKAAAPAEADLLGGGGTGGGAAVADADLLGGGSSSATTGVSMLDPLMAPAPAANTGGGSNLLAGLSMDASTPAGAPVLPTTSSSPAHAGDLASLQLGGPAPMASGLAAPMGGSGAGMGGSPALASLVQAQNKKKDEDAFGFVGAELSKAGASK